MDTTERASLLGARATVGATYPVGPQMGLRGDLGLGIARLSGLVDENPFTDDRKAASFTMLSFRRRTSPRRSRPVSRTRSCPPSCSSRRSRSST
jgi:hypothetical protein